VLAKELTQQVQGRVPLSIHSWDKINKTSTSISSAPFAAIEARFSMTCHQRQVQKYLLITPCGDGHTVAFLTKNFACSGLN